MNDYVLDGVMGLCVGDALGVPVEFMDRESLVRDPVVDMRAYGTYNQSAGTWSDDTSMTLCLLESLSNGLDYNDIMQKFINWFDLGEYSPFGEAFDIGITTGESMMRFKKEISPLECGGKGEHDNGNGSLMRILPIAFYLKSIYGTDFQEIDKAYEIIHNVSSLTHAHKRSQIACGIYISVASMIMSGMDLESAVDLGINRAMDHYRGQEDFVDELVYFKRLENKDFANLPSEEIKSSGYVVYTLEAAIWCLLNSKDYRECVLKAVNLGKDTDTVAAVVGGLAGLKYGYESIPKEWLTEIVRRDYIEELCNKFNLAIIFK